MVKTDLSYLVGDSYHLMSPTYGVWFSPFESLKLGLHWATGVVTHVLYELPGDEARHPGGGTRKQDQGVAVVTSGFGGSSVMLGKFVGGFEVMRFLAVFLISYLWSLLHAGIYNCFLAWPWIPSHS